MACLHCHVQWGPLVPGSYVRTGIEQQSHHPQVPPPKQPCAARSTHPHQPRQRPHLRRAATAPRPRDLRRPPRARVTRRDGASTSLDAWCLRAPCLWCRRSGPRRGGRQTPPQVQGPSRTTRQPSPAFPACLLCSPGMRVRRRGWPVGRLPSHRGPPPQDGGGPRRGPSPCQQDRPSLCSLRQPGWLPP